MMHPLELARDKTGMDERETAYLIAVSAAAVWTPRPLVAMLKALGSARTLVTYAQNAAAVAPPPCELLGFEALARVAAIDDAIAAAALADATVDGVRFMTSGDAGYPQRLLDLCDPPPVLYYRGNIASIGRAVAVVGSRAATPYGRNIATSVAGDLGSIGATVVSGLARGIDACAHRGALRIDAPTVAVLGSGLRALYPPYHRHLADEIEAQGGAIVSEFPPTLPARAHQFPMRNRIVAALSDATVVVEAGAKSGALITARLAAELGRPVFAFPGDVGRPSSEGSNALIKDGVALVTGAEDIAAALGWQCALPSLTSSDVDNTCIGVIAHGGSSVDEICAASGLDAASVNAQLTILEMQGLVERQAGGLYHVVRIRTRR
ncbi:MAG: DNA-protecting protein DprA [Candidatus Eremiobacteraeota bacterium]|nr:DNA-protecting protein DprA [Candidatus Eremiobacteraeota bacterium]